MPKFDKAKHLKYVIGIGIIAVALFYLVWTSLSSSFQFSLTPSELIAERALHEGKTVRVVGIVTPGSISARGEDYMFRVEDNKHGWIEVHYSGIAPNTFREGAEVIVVGKLPPGKEAFESTQMITKCASKY